jgi:hypothetical protein
MPGDGSLGRAIGELVALPFVVLRDLFRLVLWLFRLRQRWRAVPLQERNRARATGGMFALVACGVVAAHGCPFVGAKPIAGVAAFALLYLVAGLAGSRSATATVDLLAVFWRCALVIGSVALLAYAKAAGL